MTITQPDHFAINQRASQQQVPDPLPGRKVNNLFSRELKDTHTSVKRQNSSRTSTTEKPGFNQSWSADIGVIRSLTAVMRRAPCLRKEREAARYSDPFRVRERRPMRKGEHDSPTAGGLLERPDPRGSTA
jgi:hypothetical protein